jgi:hypothetical protein
MKFIYQKFFFVLALSASFSAWGQTTNSPAAPVPANSVFVQPANAREGRDPFFPESARPYESAIPTTHAIEITSLSVKGFSRVLGHEFVIINNHTFGLGEEGDVITTGGRVHIRCLEIRANYVLIEINGQQHELALNSN